MVVEEVSLEEAANAAAPDKGIATPKVWQVTLGLGAHVGTTLAMGGPKATLLWQARPRQRSYMTLARSPPPWKHSSMLRMSKSTPSRLWSIHSRPPPPASVRGHGTLPRRICENIQPKIHHRSCSGRSRGISGISFSRGPAAPCCLHPFENFFSAQSSMVPPIFGTTPRHAPTVCRRVASKEHAGRRCSPSGRSSKGIVLGKPRSRETERAHPRHLRRTSRRLRQKADVGKSP